MTRDLPVEAGSVPAKRVALTGHQARNFKFEVKDATAIITLNRPERKNPLTFESYAELRDLFRSFCDASDVKAIVITGAGDNFCSGGDVHDIIGPLTKLDKAGLLAFTQLTGDLVKAMRACPQPVIAAIDGICVGAGAILAMASDIRLGTSRCKIAFLFTRVGLAGCDMGACAILPRIIGQGRASELLFTGRNMLGDEAERWGFLNRLCTSEALMPEAMSVAGGLASGPTFAHAMTKKMLHEEWNMGVDQAIDAEAEAQATCMTTNDFHRAYHAFVNKQKPEFKGD
jgi:enoyl-CoA hydratase/carnithine racemase